VRAVVAGLAIGVLLALTKYVLRFVKLLASCEQNRLTFFFCFSTPPSPSFSLFSPFLALYTPSYVLSFSMYFGLQTGWISMMSLQASLLGFAVFKVLPASPWFSSRPLTIHENIVIQTTAVATGTLPLGAGYVGVIPALAQLDPKLDGSEPLILGWKALIAWCFAVAFLYVPLHTLMEPLLILSTCSGVFLAVPLRRQVVVKEKLVFPSGTATAQVIGVLHGRPLISSGAEIEGETETEGARRRRRRAIAPASEVVEEEEAILRRAREDEDLEAEEAELERSTADKSREEEKGVDAQSWNRLMISFSISAGYTVRPPFLLSPTLADPTFSIATQPRLSRHLRRSSFRHLRQAGCS
jgi:hypothetical protein